MILLTSSFVRTWILALQLPLLIELQVVRSYLGSLRVRDLHPQGIAEEVVVFSYSNQGKSCSRFPGCVGAACGSVGLRKGAWRVPFWRIPNPGEVHAWALEFDAGGWLELVVSRASVLLKTHAITSVSQHDHHHGTTRSLARHDGVSCASWSTITGASWRMQQRVMEHRGC